MIAIDWSHRKDLTTYDGKKVSVIDRKSLVKRLAGESKLALKSRLEVNPASLGVDEESTFSIESKSGFNSSAPLIILEQGCPLALIYDILSVGCQVKVISNRATHDYRMDHDLKKTDETDAKLIYELANNGAKLTPVSLDDKDLQLLELYQRYKRFQKARVTMMNMKKGYIRQFGDGESTQVLKSKWALTPSPMTGGEGESILPIESKRSFHSSPSDGTLPYDIGIDTLKAAESSCLKKIVKLAPPIPQSLEIRGLGPRLWAGIFITANPANFPTLSSYLRYCGLVNLDQLDHQWNRHARMLYHLLAEEVMQKRDEHFRPIYDKCKADIAQNHQNYTKAHIHRAALNRTATFLAKEIFKIHPFLPYWGKME